MRHFNGEFQVKSSNLRELWLKVQELEKSFQKISFVHVPRMDKHIEEADLLANQTLNKVIDSTRQKTKREIR